MNLDIKIDLVDGIKVITVQSIERLELFRIADEVNIEVYPELNCTMSEIYESDISFSYRYFKDGKTLRFYQLLK